MKDCHEPSVLLTNREYNRLDLYSVFLSWIRAVASAVLLRILRLFFLGFMQERRDAAISVIVSIILMVAKRTRNDEQIPFGGSVGLFSQNIFEADKYVDA